MARPTHIQIDPSAIAYNLQVVKSLCKSSKVISIVKANGYGHGIQFMPEALSETDAFGVHSIDEAYILRQYETKKPIVLLLGFNDVTELDDLVYYGLVPVIHDWYQLEVLERANLKKPISIWLKMNTGINRLGFLPEEFNQVIKKLERMDCINKPIQVMTHFSSAQNYDEAQTQKQMDLFTNTLGKQNALPKSAANSGAILLYPDTHLDYVRPGLMLFGLSPFSDKHGQDLGLKPAMKLVSKIIGFQSVKRGEGIGYERSFIAKEDMKLGIVPIGYADGYPRAKNPDGIPVMVNGQLTATKGLTSMDMVAVDITHLPNTKIGDEVELWGPNLPLEKVAASVNRSTYEFPVHLSVRLPLKRVIVDWSEA